MNTEEFLALKPCLHGREYALTFPSIKDAWEACDNVSNLCWLAVKSGKCKDQISIFAWECASIAQAHSETANAAYAADAAADAANAAADDYAADAANAAYAADAAADAANAAAYAAYARKTELKWQVIRIKQLCTHLIFGE